MNAHSRDEKRRRILAILDNYQWEDETIYHWKLKSSTFFGSVLMFFGNFVLFPLGLYGFCWLVGLLSPPIAAIIAFLLAAGILTWFFEPLCVRIGHRLGMVRDHRLREIEQSHFILYPNALLGPMFYLLREPGMRTSEYFAGNSFSDVQWLLFYVDNFLSVALLDVTDLFNVHFSQIRVRGTFSRVVALIVRLLIGFGLLQYVLWIYKTKFLGKGGTFFGTVRDLFWHAEGLIDRRYVRGRILGKVVEAHGEQEFSIDDFVEAYHRRARRQPPRSEV